jgi:uncharacterized coiled-coil protein SlyX
MPEDTVNLVLEHLRAIRSVQDQHSRKFADLEMRLGAIEQHMAGYHISDMRQNSEIDRLKEQMDRIEKRLELVDGR